ncbi:cytochrome c biogenesis factor [Halarchaeum solikamskense]|nr:cytochrome c biogenesis factor [Halarchaeum solikamskense]
MFAPLAETALPLSAVSWIVLVLGIVLAAAWWAYEVR